MISAADAEDKALFSAATGHRVGTDFNGIKLVVDGKLVAMTGFDYWTPNAAQIHIWLPQKLGLRGRLFFKELFHYIFVTCDKGVVLGTIPASNPACINFTRGMGFTALPSITDGWDVGVDMTISEMRRENCIWIDKQYRTKK